MDGRRLQEVALECVETLPGSEIDHPFGPEYDVARVRGRMFLLLTRVPATSTGYGVTDAMRGHEVVVLKADPEDATALRDTHPSIGPGYHLDKRHWITLAPGDDIDEDLVAELVTDSYRAVVAGLPRRVRPVDPAVFRA